MIYLDNAATTLIKPAAVEHSFVSAMRSMASPGRGGHLPARRAAETVFSCREAAAELFNVENPENVVFTSNATHALNIAIGSLAKKGTRALMSGFEHNSVSRPLRAAGAAIAIAGRELFDSAAVLEDFAGKIPDSDLVVCTHVSNVFGFVLPIYEIAQLCRQHGVPLIVDASQSAGVLEIDAARLGAAFIAMPGHKALYGPQGTGILLCGQPGTPLSHGGSGSDSIPQHMPEYLPDRLEAGTHNVCGIAALMAGIEYVKEKGTGDILRHEQQLLMQLQQELRGSSYELFCGDEGTQTGLLSLRHRKLDCEELAQKLAARSICVRSGMHCAPTAHISAGTIKTGTVRLSFSPFTTETQVHEAGKALREIDIF